MKKSFILITFFVLALRSVTGQAYSEDFESFTTGDFLGTVSPYWTTWSGRTGGSEDIQINDSNANSGRKSLFYDSPRGGGPQNVVMPFNVLLNSGKFRFSSMFFVPRGNNAAFNFQGNPIVGTSTSMEFLMFDNGTFDVNGLTGGYPTDRWFEVRVEVDFDVNKWMVYVDSRFIGSFSCRVNSVAHLNLFGPNPNSTFWIDDVNYCIKNACNPDIAMRNLRIAPNPLCSNHTANVTLSLVNNGPDAAKGFELALQMNGQSSIRHKVVLDSLLPGKDTIIVIPQLFRTNITGTQLDVAAVNIDHDVDLSNDTIRTQIDVYASPYGSTLLRGNVFQGSMRTGMSDDPDLLETGKTNSYFLTPPSAYTNASYNSDWTIRSVEARTAFGVLVPAGQYVFSNPSAAGNGRLQLTAQTGYTDSVITFYFVLQNTGNACDTLIKRSIRVVPVPKIEYNVPDTVCVGNIVEFENKTTIHSGQTVGMWYFGDNDSSDNTNPVHVYSATGTYQVKLSVRSFPYGFLKDTSMLIQVVEKPVVKFSVKNKCEGEPLEFTNLSSVSIGNLKYEWDFGDGTAPVSAVHPQHIYGSTGLHSVKLTAGANGCAASFMKNVYQFPLPVADFIAPSSGICAGQEISLTNTSNISSGIHHASWDFGDGHTSTQNDGLHSYAKSGTYAVQLTALSDFGCKDSIVKNINILTTPVPSFTADRFCNGLPTVFRNTSANKSLPNTIYKWELSDGYTSYQNEIRHTWSAAGIYTVTLSARSINGCSGSTTEEVTVLPQPLADFGVEDICLGETASFENRSRSENGDIQYFWDFGNNFTSNQHSPKMQYEFADVYPVQLIASYPKGCSDTTIRIIGVSDTPVCKFDYVSKGNMNFTFIPGNTGYSRYEWFFGDGSSTSDTSPEYRYDIGGTYKVTMRATNAAGCTCEGSRFVSAGTAVNTTGHAAGILVYPNPGNGLLTVQNAEDQAMQVAIFNTLGEKVYEGQSETGSLTIDLTAQARGVYIVKVLMNTKGIITKVTIAD